MPSPSTCISLMRTTDNTGDIVSQKLSMELTIVVGEKIRGGWRHRSLRYFKLTSMTFDQYQAAVDRLMEAIVPLGEEFIKDGYEMYWRGKPATEKGEGSVDYPDATD